MLFVYSCTARALECLCSRVTVPVSCDLQTAVPELAALQKALSAMYLTRLTLSSKIENTFARPRRISRPRPTQERYATLLAWVFQLLFRSKSHVFLFLRRPRWYYSSFAVVCKTLHSPRRTRAFGYRYGMIFLVVLFRFHKPLPCLIV